jgi:hypothetical protein
MTKLSGTLPKEYSDDGLGSINQELIAHPHETRVVVALIDCKTITKDADSGLEVATARILHVEPITDPDHEDRAREMLLDAQEQRTGRKALPLVTGDTGEVDGTAAAILRRGAGVLAANGVTEIRFGK